MKMDIYELTGYCGNPNAYDGPQDNNYKKIIAIPNSMSKTERNFRLNNFMTPFDKTDMIIGSAKLIKTIDIDI